MPFMSALSHRGRRIEAHRPYPRVAVDEETWRQATLGLAAGEATLLALWSDGEAVHMCLADAVYARIVVVSLTTRDRRFPSVGLTHPPALRLERAIRDLYGLEPEGIPDTRPWLDHGRWGIAEPLGRRRPRSAASAAYSFLKAEGPPLHQIAVGPVHAGIIEPGHFRFSANGETVVRLEERLGYVHKGIEGLMIDAPLAKAAMLAARVSGDSTVAYSMAFARAIESALEVNLPRRAVALRAVMAELERLANHFGDIGAICNDASFSLLHAHFGALREQVLRTADKCFGHRLMMDRIVPGGVASDITPRGMKSLEALLALVRRTFPELVELYDNTASLQDRTVATGILKAEFVRRYGAGGFIGRASGRSIDARRNPGYAPYTRLKFDVPVRENGDVDARIWVRIAEVDESLGLLDQLVGDLPDDAILTDVDAPASANENPEGLSIVEGFRGDVLCWVRMGEGGSVARAHLRDPSWFQWPLLEAAIDGNIVADFPLCNKSFNCSYSGHDL
jgi:Ni,Fe-hydrogenase III large subunit